MSKMDVLELFMFFSCFYTSYRIGVLLVYLLHSLYLEIYDAYQKDPLDCITVSFFRCIELTVKIRLTICAIIMFNDYLNSSQ